ncbi:MAG: 1,6-anhydro-N-acetylmuramyl-L-alanine amidase AmpD, partial [Gammaproteobacteria bacterium]|nr:1,6-anhydro-N-acetylmuramyl-L-alanine amidase AmpD [Gammaproteobacteria bacterium]
MDVESGFIREARQVSSPNFDDRPPGCCADLIIVHGISLPPGEFSGEW